MKYQSPGCILRGSDVTGVGRGAEDCSERPSAAGPVHRPSVPALGAHSPGMASSPVLPSLPSHCPKKPLPVILSPLLQSPGSLCVVGAGLSET